MLLGLALEYVECLNNQESPVIETAFERVVSIESERVVEQLYQRSVANIHKNFDFDSVESNDGQNLEQVYS